MPLPTPRQGEEQEDFISRCMGNQTARQDFPDQSQRAAVCFDQWQANNNGGSTAQYYTINRRVTTAQVWTTQWQGREYLVSPVVLLTEGVHNSANMGRILHTPDELCQFTGAWNGRPVTIRHPETSASFTPETLAEVQVGTLFNVEYTDQNGPPRLVGEIWLDTEKANQKSPGLVDHLRSGQIMEVSTGVFHEKIPVQGTWNDEVFDYQARGYRPDHLALLPDQCGACSIEDGCGTPRLNNEGGEVKNGKNDSQQGQEETPPGGGVLAKLKKAIGWAEPEPDEEVSAFKELMKEMVPPSVNADGPEYANLVKAIQGGLDRMDREGRLHFLEALYDEYYVYRVATPEGEFYYKQPYQPTDNNGFANIGEPVKVKKEVNWIENEEDQQAQNAQGDANMDVKEMVDKIIANSNGLYTEADREYLTGQCPDTLTAKVQALESETKTEDPDSQPEDPAANNSNQSQPSAKMTMDQFMAMLPQEAAAALNQVAEQNKRNREMAINALAQATGHDKAALEKLDDNAITMMLAAVLPANNQHGARQVDYSLQGGGGHGTVASDVPGLYIDDDYAKAAGKGGGE